MVDPEIQYVYIKGKGWVVEPSKPHHNTTTVMYSIECRRPDEYWHDVGEWVYRQIINTPENELRNSLSAMETFRDDLKKRWPNYDFRVVYGCKIISA